MHGVPMRIAKLSAQNLIDTFGDNDFFNVVYVSINAFSSVRKQHYLSCSTMSLPLSNLLLWAGLFKARLSWVNVNFDWSLIANQ